MHHHFRRRSAFTLIELLVVVAVIAVLVAALIPAAERAREQGSRIKCLSAARQVAIASLSYATDCDMYLPRGSLTTPMYSEVLVKGQYASQKLFVAAGGCPHGPVAYSLAAGNEYYGLPNSPVTTFGLNYVLQSGHGYTTPSGYAWHGTARLTDDRLARYGSYVPLIMDSFVPFYNRTTEQALVTVSLRTMGYDTLAAYLAGDAPTLTGLRHMSEGFNIVNIDGTGRFTPKDAVLKYCYSDWTKAWAPYSNVWGLRWINMDYTLEGKRAIRDW